VYLLDSAAGVVDRVVLGGPYAPGILRDLEPAGAGCLEFSFHGPERWRVTVRAKPRGRFRKHRLELLRVPYYGREGEAARAGDRRSQLAGKAKHKNLNHR